MAGENCNRMPDGENSSAIRPMPDRGVMSGVTDTYDSNLEAGYNNVSNETEPSPKGARSEC